MSPGLAMIRRLLSHLGQNGIDNSGGLDRRHPEICFRLTTNRVRRIKIIPITTRIVPASWFLLFGSSFYFNGFHWEKKLF